MIAIDIDHFKRINDDYGHPVGDLVLQDFATCCQRMLRTEDLCARTGGEEFFILLPNTTMAAAHAIAERIRVESAACQVSPEHPQLRITASFGVADMGAADANFGAIFSRHVKQANEGCDFDFLEGTAPTAEPEIH